jgi:hypothetical protein
MKIFISLGETPDGSPCSPVGDGGSHLPQLAKVGELLETQCWVPHVLSLFWLTWGSFLSTPTRVST